MIVCSCNVLTDRVVREALALAQTQACPPRTAREVYDALGCAPQCGRCAPTMRALMEECACPSGACCAGEREQSLVLAEVCAAL